MNTRGSSNLDSEARLVGMRDALRVAQELLRRTYLSIRLDDGQLLARYSMQAIHGVQNALVMLDAMIDHVPAEFDRKPQGTQE